MIRWKLSSEDCKMYAIINDHQAKFYLFGRVEIDKTCHEVRDIWSSPDFTF